MIRITPNAIDQSVEIHLVDEDGQDKLDATAADLGCAYRRGNGPLVPVVLNDLLGISNTHVDGGVIHIFAGNYRLDLPDAAFVSGVDYVTVYLGNAGILQTAGPLTVALDAPVTSRLASGSYTTPPTADAIGTDAASKILATPANKLVTDENGKVALTPAERDSFAALVESHLLDDLDGQAYINALVAAIGNQNVDELSLVAALRADLERPGGFLNTLILRATEERLNKLDIAGPVATAAQVSTLSDGFISIGNKVDAVAAQTNKLQFGADNDLKATLDGEAVKLASDGLDSISIAEPDGVATNFREMLVQLWSRFFRRVTMTTNEIKTYKADGTTVATTQQIIDDGTAQEQGSAE